MAGTGSQWLLWLSHQEQQDSTSAKFAAAVAEAVVAIPASIVAKV